MTEAQPATMMFVTILLAANIPGTVLPSASDVSNDGSSFFYYESTKGL